MAPETDNKELLLSYVNNFQREKESILAHHTENRAEQRTYLNGIFIIVGFSVTVSVYMFDLFEKSNESLIGTSLLLSTLCCIYGIYYVYAYWQWKKRLRLTKIDDEFGISFTASDEESRIREFKRVIVMDARAFYQVNSSATALIGCSLLFIGSFLFLCIYAFFDKILIPIGEYSISAGVVIFILLFVIVGIFLLIKARKAMSEVIKRFVSPTNDLALIIVMFPQLSGKDYRETVSFICDELLAISAFKKNIILRSKTMQNDLLEIVKELENDNSQ